jgi:hypothetical protein
VHFLQAVVERGRAERFGEQARAGERAGVQGERLRQQRPQAGGNLGGAFGQAEIGLPVADAGRDGGDGGGG